MDDILVHSRNLDVHLRDLDWTLNALKDAGFILNPDKCQFGVKEVEFLGHRISSQGIGPMPDKLDTIQNLQPPRNIK